MLLLLSHLQCYRLYPLAWILPMGFTRQEYWSGLPCPPPGDLPDPGIVPSPLVYYISRWILDPAHQLGSPFYTLYAINCNADLSPRTSTDYKPYVSVCALASDKHIRLTSYCSAMQFLCHVVTYPRSFSIRRSMSHFPLNGYTAFHCTDRI